MSTICLLPQVGILDRPKSEIAQRLKFNMLGKDGSHLFHHFCLFLSETHFPDAFQKVTLSLFVNVFFGCVVCTYRFILYIYIYSISFFTIMQILYLYTYP